MEWTQTFGLYILGLTVRYETSIKLNIVVSSTQYVVSFFRTK